jgi:hypothetical protein
MVLTQEQIDNINQQIPKNYLWDGFWINDFAHGVLDISASFDRIYYRNLKLAFTGVTFFNLPESWRDTDIATENFLRLGHQRSFTSSFREIDLTDKTLIDIYLYMPVAGGEKELYGFSIVCDTVTITRFDKGDGAYNKTYTDPLEGKMNYPIIHNRVPHL